VYEGRSSTAANANDHDNDHETALVGGQAGRRVVVVFVVVVLGRWGTALE
jgi:hypothetical protein